MSQLVSIIIPVYNAEHTLCKCLDSILEQNFNNYEIILVNDGSKDSSLEICKEYSSKHQNISVINQNNAGVSSARNAGLEIAKGDWITFIDSDDYIEDIFFNCLDTYNEDLIILNSKTLSPTGDISDSLFSKTNNQLHKKSSITHFISNNIDNALFRSPWAKFYKKELIKNIRFDTNMKIGEDSHFVFRYLCNIKSIQYLGNEAHYIIRLSEQESNVKYSSSIDYSIKSLQKLFQAYSQLQTIFPITNKGFVSYVGYFKLICRDERKKSLRKWWKNKSVKEMYQFTWKYLSLSQKVKYFILSII
ncbi:MAG: glycosyltransferase family 2 protein [Prevotella sp.]